MGIKGNRILDQQERTVKLFDKLHVSMGIKAELTNDSPGTVRLEGETNILPFVITEVKDGELLITFPTGQPLYDIVDVRVKLGVGPLEKIRVDIGASIHSKKTLSALVLTAQLASGGSFSSFLQVDQLDLRMDSGSVFELAGESNEAKITLNGGSQLSGNEFTTADCTIALSGKSNAYLRIKKSLEATANGESELQYIGEPDLISVRSSDTSEIEGIKLKAR